MKVGIVTFPGSNGDYDAYQAAVEGVGAAAVYLWHKDRSLQDVDVVILPGGFSYGDYLRAGAIARFSPIMAEVAGHAKRGAPVLGFCNGFQIACEAQLLPGALLRNDSLQFVCAEVPVRVEAAVAMLDGYRPGQVVRLPIAHGDGRYTADADTLDRLEGDGRIAFRYVSSAGDVDPAWNPNGSARAIAGIVNAHGNVLGMMPHPERAVDPLVSSGAGRPLFESLLARVGA